MQMETTTRLRLVLSQREYAALLQACEQSLRTPDAEVRIIIRRELQQLGLLPAEGETADA